MSIANKEKYRKLNHGYLYYNKKIILLLRFIDKVLKIFSKKKRGLPKKINKILIVKPDHLGDVFLATSLISVIRKKFPNAQLDALCMESSSFFLKSIPDMHKVFTIDHPFLSRSKKKPTIYSL